MRSSFILVWVSLVFLLSCSGDPVSQSNLSSCESNPAGFENISGTPIQSTDLPSGRYVAEETTIYFNKDFASGRLAFAAREEINRAADGSILSESAKFVCANVDTQIYMEFSEIRSLSQFDKVDEKGSETDRIQGMAFRGHWFQKTKEGDLKLRFYQLEEVDGQSIEDLKFEQIRFSTLLALPKDYKIVDLGDDRFEIRSSLFAYMDELEGSDVYIAVRYRRFPLPPGVLIPKESSDSEVIQDFIEANEDLVRAKKASEVIEQAEKLIAQELNEKDATDFLQVLHDRLSAVGLTFFAGGKVDSNGNFIASTVRVRFTDRFLENYEKPQGVTDTDQVSALEDFVRFAEGYLLVFGENSSENGLILMSSPKNYLSLKIKLVQKRLSEFTAQRK